MVRSSLVYPPITIWSSDPSGAGPVPPLGLAYIAAVLEEESQEVEILDALALGINHRERHGDFSRIGLSYDDIRRHLEDSAPDIVGISTMFTAYEQNAHEVAGIVKEISPDILVVFGGSHASVCPELVLKDRNVDIVVKGEGELTFLELVENMEGGKDVFKTEGTIVRKGSRIFYNPERPFIKDLDSIPFPARHLLSMDIYLEASKKIGERFCMRTPVASMITSRGCPGRCIFCSIHSVWKHTWRARSAKNVVDEMELLTSMYGAREIHFYDDNVSIDKKRMGTICDEIIRRKLDIKWTTPNGIALWALNKPLMEKMKRSGCYRLTFGIESGSQKTQQLIGKNIDLNRARSTIRDANDLGLWTICTFILGFPFESRASIEETIRFAIDSDTDFALFYLLIPFPGTQVFEMLKDKGILGDTSQEIGLRLSGMGGCDTEFLTKEELREIQNRAYSELLASRFHRYLKPSKWLSKINSFEDLLYICKIAKSALRIKINQKKFGNVGARALYCPTSDDKE